MSNEQWSQLADEIKAHSSNDFARLQVADLPSGSETARFHWYPDRINPRALVKVFVGESAGSLYRQEITALYVLRATGRVCVVLCNSTKYQTKFWDQDSPGLYFIAKLYYPKTLESALRTATGLEKLDLAAQEVDIARLFFRLKWRDYDWRKENDVIDDAGRVLRVDLDSASALTGFFEQKSTVGKEDFFSIDESVALIDFLKKREDLLKASEPNEVRNLAIRLAHSLFIDSNDKGELRELVRSIQSQLERPAAPPEDSTERHSDIRHVALFGFPILRKASGLGGFITKWATAMLGSNSRNGQKSDRSRLIQSQSLNVGARGLTVTENDASKEATFDRWVDLWLRQEPSQSSASSRVASLEGLSRLTKEELGLLARLFHHLISGLNHGFSLDDLHVSLVMMAVASLRDRVWLMGNSQWSEDQMIKNFAPSTRFFEVRNTLLHPASGTVQLTENELVMDRAAPSPRLARPKLSTLEIEALAKSGYWGAAKKELGRRCEDWAFALSTERFLVAVVADGVSEASGFEAAQMVEKVVIDWKEELSGISSEAMSNEIAALLQKINLGLIGKSKETRRPHQAMLAMVVVVSNGRSCSAWIAKAGEDSDCVVFLPDGTPRYSTKSIRTTRLGEIEILKDASVSIDRIALSPDEGTYRFRLFSDGVGERGYERLREVASIDQVVREAEHWPETLSGTVGHDDWSIAGFDLCVNENSIRSDEEFEIKEAFEKFGTSVTAPISLLSVVAEVDPAKMQLSEEARRFWRETLESVSARGDGESPMPLGFIREVVGQPQHPWSSPFKRDDAKPDVAHLPERNRKKIWGIKRVGLAIVAATVLIYVGYNALMWLRPSPIDDGGSERLTGPSAPSPNQRATTEVDFTGEAQRIIFSALKERGSYLQPGLPGGEGVSNPAIQDFLRDLAQVLKGSKYNVTIEVFSAPGGDPVSNMGITDRRAKRIRQSLLDQKVPEGQILQVVGRGAPTAALVQQSDPDGAIVIISRRD